ncbi:MAG: PD-(D/E)XK nuclease family protein [Thermovirgaceae bacterium]|nr:PD-(D/E)XK nuclease family protein [Thermovirgaceae bacterium]
MPIRIVEYHSVRDIEAELSKLGGERDPEPLFLVPSPGDRELLRDIILEKVSFGPGEPSVLRWEDLYREVLRELDIPQKERRRQIDPPDHWLIVRHILGEFNSREREDAIPPGARQRGFVWTLGENLRELLREEVLPEALASSLGCSSCVECEHCPLVSTPHGLLCRLYRDYIAYLGLHSLADSAQTASITRMILSGHPAEAEKWIRGRHFIFAGFMSFTHSQSGLIREIARLGGKITVFMPESGLDIHDALDQLEGLPPGQARMKRHVPIPSLLVSAGDHRIELETVIRNLALWPSGEGEFAHRLERPFPGWGNIGLSVDHVRLDPAEEILNRYHVPFVVNGGPKVSQTPLWQTAASALEAGRLGYPSEETAYLLSQPWISPDGFPLSRALEAGPVGDKKWRSFLQAHGDAVLSANFERVVSFGSSIGRGGTPSNLLRYLRSLAGDGEVSEWGKALSRFIIPDPELDETARRLNAAARELDQKIERVADLERDIGPAGCVVLRGNDATAFLSAWAERSTVWQPPKSLDSLNLYAGSPPVLAHHPVLAATGLTADAWPGRLRESPLLDDSRKEVLHKNPEIGLSPVHLPLLREKRMQREALLRRIIASADSVCIASRPCQDESGRPLQRSVMLDSALSQDPPWITDIGGDPPFSRSMKDVLPGDGETLIEGIEVRADDPPRSPARLRCIPPASPWPPALERRAAISGIDSWAECPFKYYAEKTLGIRKIRTFGFDHLAAGTMIHALWEKVWDTRLTAGDTLSVLVEKFWYDTLHRHYPALERLPRHLLRLRAQTGKMADLQQRIEDAGLAAARKEQRRERDIMITVEGVPFRGRYDRLDILSDGTALIVDYKTGRSNGLSKSLQLAAYASALRETESLEVSGYAFLSQGDCKLTGRLTGTAAAILSNLTGHPRTTLGEMVASAEETCANMAKSISEGKFPPKYDNYQVCRFCDFQGLCRRGEAAGAGGEDDDGPDD